MNTKCILAIHVVRISVKLDIVFNK